MGGSVEEFGLNAGHTFGMFAAAVFIIGLIIATALLLANIIIQYVNHPNVDDKCLNEKLWRTIVAIIVILIIIFLIGWAAHPYHYMGGNC